MSVRDIHSTAPVYFEPCGVTFSLKKRSLREALFVPHNSTDHTLALRKGLAIRWLP